jgi:hypothetical protein
MANIHVADVKMGDFGVSIDGLQGRIVEELALFKEAFTAFLWGPDSRDEVVRALKRAGDDPRFIAQLTHHDSYALRDYHLTPQAKAALLSGDINWLETHVGKLNERQETWLRCRLEQEIW